MYMVFIFCWAFAFLLYKYLTRNYNYWKKRELEYVKPTVFFGNLLQMFTEKIAFGELLGNYYSTFETPLFGMYLLHKPVLVIRDPLIIKRILIQDFQHFYDHSILSNEDCDGLASNMLFFCKNPQWKDIRIRMTPTFTTAKIKNMYGLIKVASNELISYLNHRDQDVYIDVKEVFLKFSSDVISSCAFGINANCFKSETSPFYLMCKKMFTPNWGTGFNQISYFIAQGFVKRFKLPFFDAESSEFLRKVFWKTLEDRENTKVIRHDVIDAIKEFKDNPNLSGNFKFEGDRILAQAVQFFAAGFETVSSAISFALYELSLQPEIQNKLRLEIKNSLLSNNSIDYSVITNLRYLHMVVQETLRKYPILSFLERKCNQSYPIPEGNFTIEAGTEIYIPLLGLHYDPEYFPNPERFDPERFSDRDVESSLPYWPFGGGPRNCIGSKFALIVMKVALYDILAEFRIEPSPTAPRKLSFVPGTVFLNSSTGVPLKLKADRVLA